MREHSDRVRDLFEATAQDLTPATARQAVRVLYSPVSRDPEVTRSCAAVLSDGELQRADRFAASGDRTLFLQRRAFRRFCAATEPGLSRPLSQIVFEETENGRPYLPTSTGLWFSFSSCRLGFLGAWSPTHAVGVDLEDPTRNMETTDLARRFFSRAEADAIEQLGSSDRLPVFYRYWSLKEAALKSIGEGLPFGLDTFEFELDPQLRIASAPLRFGGPERFDAHLLGQVESCAALVIRRLA